MATIKIPHKLRNELWWLVISVDFDYSRIAIADHEINGEHITFWLEDKHNYKNSLDECLNLDIQLRQFAKLIREQGFNSYEATKMHADKKFSYRKRVDINNPISWYRDDASPTEQTWAREAMLKAILTQLIETEVHAGNI
ncbi:hypothetical protein [Mucilaginibacter myungsuensis]|uniref:Uncharacterized protein n=1 Tax=Mucilaginibacter myungsuensis TaxID=649104 RepID=A0A929KX09_9SPHI|nr:hypothetical protein [Mucilaginibacter myungsuensis]MBE9662008.1 hypothetical protein [Mucilaginibacter myungsuensis]MDN3599559.1 hypothetical protein [Mucilaginibacter myungsuensis]